MVQCPIIPRLEVNTQVQVNKTVGKWRWHTIDNTTVSVTVTSGNNNNVLWQFIGANTTIKNQLVRSSLCCWCGRVHFVKEQEHYRILGSFFCGWKIRRRIPHSITNSRIVVENALQIGRVHKCKTQVIQLATHVFAKVCNEFGLTDTRRTPKEYRTLATSANHDLTLCSSEGNRAHFGECSVSVFSHLFLHQLTII